ncbi:MAG: hypothetical protein Tsb009_19210 [Planctomycetaceae bacterium]
MCGTTQTAITTDESETHETDNPTAIYIPSPEEIKRECQAIQNGSQ